MNILREFIKRIRFKFIIVLYIIGSLLWGISQYKDKIDLSILKTFTMRDVQDIVNMHLEEKKTPKSSPEPIVKRQLAKNEPAFHVQKNISLNNTVVFHGRASVTSGVTFKLFTPVAQSWRRYMTRSVHLYGVDTCAPRQKAKLNDQEWPCGAVTTAWLVTKTLGRNLSCKLSFIHNGIFYAQCFVDGIDLAEIGLAEGMLVISKEGKNPVPEQYRSAENTARNNKVGLWSSHFTEPLKWRQDNGSYNPFAGF
ncbi:endonuclease YncB(thermonuclease family) [Bartonella japonica]|uniref:Endonuclease YncB(Thermonuclease family) n=1 Tax=Bartonella japonica TaxID=357761 RepID=A0ABV2FPQ1_9HYPH